MYGETVELNFAILEPKDAQQNGDFLSPTSSESPMSVAIYINKASEANALVSWGIRFAHTDSTSLLIVVPRRQKQDPAKFDPLMLDERDQNEIFEAVFAAIETHSTDHVVLKEKIDAGYSDIDRVLIETREIVATNPEDAFVQNVSTMEVKTLILPAVEDIQTSSEAASWAQQLYETAPCETLMVRGAPPEDELNILVVANKDRGADVALSRAARLASASAISLTDDEDKAQEQTVGKVDFLFVRPDDDEVAFQVAELHTKKILSRAGSKCKNIEPKIVLGDNLMEVVTERVDDRVDLILMGTRHLKTIRSLFRQTSSASSSEDSQCRKRAVAVIRPAVPLGNRLSQKIQMAVRQVVPQLEKESRVKLVDRLQEGSSFNFDFASLIALSTIIAAFGLLDDSAAVVIGAMLVAPLMTPLVGIGFALIQGNERLMRTALKSVLLGFAVAFLIAAVLGVLTNFLSSIPISGQMEARDEPAMLDLLVALFSGVAAAYAMSRPNLLSALPGVAIAAALVPPIATAGMSLTMGDSTLGGGALLLFFTNIVAIVLGTAVTFWAVGIDTRLIKAADGTQRRPRIWARYWFLGFVVLSIALAVWMEYTHSKTSLEKFIDWYRQNVPR